MSAPLPDVGALWLAVFQRALGRASHDVKDLLNGVSVNLEVVRSRAGRVESTGSAISPFADAATQQLERLTSLLDAVLTLGRVERDPADVGMIMRGVAVLCGASNTAEDSAVTVRAHLVGDARTRVLGDAVRLAITAPLLDAVMGKAGNARATAVDCELSEEAGTLVVRLHADRPVPMPAGVAPVLRAHGVRWVESPHDLSLAFPRA